MTGKKMKAHVFIVLFVFGCAFLCCGKTGSAGMLKVAVTILPQEFFVEKIGGNHVNVTVMVPPGAEPHSYEPKPRQMVTLSESQIYFTIGIEFDRVWIKRIISSNKNIRVFAMDSNIEKVPMATIFPQKGQERAIHKDFLDPHIWLSPPMVKKISVNIARALVEVDPVHAKEYHDNLRKFRHEIDQLHIFIQEKLRGEKSSSFLVFHPAWGYFARTYGLHQISIETEGKEPSPRELSYLINFARKQNIKVVFSEPQFSPRTAEIIAKQIHGTVVNVDPLAFDWENNLRHVATVIGKALKQ